MMREKRNGRLYGGYNKDIVDSIVQRKISEMKAILRELGGKPTTPRWPL